MLFKIESSMWLPNPSPSTGGGWQKNAQRQKIDVCDLWRVNRHFPKLVWNLHNFHWYVYARPKLWLRKHCSFANFLGQFGWNVGQPHSFILWTIQMVKHGMVNISNRIHYKLGTFAFPAQGISWPWKMKMGNFFPLLTPESFGALEFWRMHANPPEGALHHNYDM